MVQYNLPQKWFSQKETSAVAVLLRSSFDLGFSLDSWGSRAQSSEVAGAPSVRDAGGHLERENTSWVGLMANSGEAAMRTSGAGVLPALSRSACGDDARNRLGEDL